MTSLEVGFDKYDYGKHRNFRLLKDKSTYQKVRQTAVTVYNRGHQHGQRRSKNVLMQVRSRTMQIQPTV